MSDHTGGEDVRQEASGGAFMAHELVHGLASILTASEVALNVTDKSFGSVEIEDWSELREALQFIVHETQSQVYQALTVLHRSMPKYAVGLIRPVFERRPPLDLLIEMLPPYTKMAKQRGIEMEVAPEPLPEGFPAIELERSTVRRLFHNVLTNAIKYSYAGNVRRDRSIRIWGQRHDARGDMWAVKIQNFGVGIKGEELSEIFRPGYRGILARGEGTFGTGIGLADALECMRLHNGTITLKSEPSGGEAYLTTCSLVFPRNTGIRGSFDKEVLLGG